jgi:hypothetical protein
VIISHIFTSASSERSIRRSLLIISTIRIEFRFRLNSTARNKNFPTVCKNSKTVIWKFGSWTWWKSDVETCELDEKTNNQMRTWSKWGTWWKSVITWWKSADLDQSDFVRLSEDVEVWSASISLRHHLLCFPVFNYIDGTASIYGPSSIVINLMLPLPYIFTNKNEWRRLIFGMHSIEFACIRKKMKIWRRLGSNMTRTNIWSCLSNWQTDRRPFRILWTTRWWII